MGVVRGFFDVFVLGFKGGSGGEGRSELILLSVSFWALSFRCLVFTVFIVSYFYVKIVERDFSVSFAVYCRVRIFIGKFWFAFIVRGRGWGWGLLYF